MPAESPAPPAPGNGGTRLGADGPAPKGRIGQGRMARLPLAGGANGAETSASGGGRAYVGKPEIKTVACAAGCVRKTRVRNGGSVKLRGRKLSYASKVLFLGGRGRSDDV